jgi:anti-anti-sigma factor
VAHRLREQVLAAPDRLDLENSEPFRQAAVALLDTLGKAPGRLVVDLGATQMIDSAGLRVLIMVRRHATSRGTVVGLRGMSAELQSLLALAKMEDLFEIEDRTPT